MPKPWLFGVIFSIASMCAFAQKSKDSLLQVIAANKGHIDEVRAHIYLASEYLRSDAKKAKTYTLAAIPLAKALNNVELESGLYSLLTTIHTNGGNIDSAQYYLQLLKALSAQYPDAKLHTLHYNYISSTGLFYKKQGNYKVALPYLIKAAGISVQMNNKESAAGQFLNIGNTYMLVGEHKLALKYHLQALKLFENIGNKRGISFCYQGISSDFAELRQFDKALNYAKSALQVKQELGDKRGVSSTYTSLGEIYTGKQQYAFAQDYFLKALQIAKEMGLKNEEAKITVGLGNLYAAQKEPEKAKAFYHTAKELSAASGDTAILLTADAALMTLQKSLLQAAQKEKALVSNLQSTIRRGDKNDEAATYQHLSAHYEGSGNFEKALFYNKRYYQKRDSLTNAQVQVDVARLEEQYKNEIRENEIQLLQKDQQLSKAKLQRQQSLQWGGLLFLGLLVIGGLLLFNRYRALHRARRQLEMEKIRNNIARDLHDDIGSTLSSIHILSKVLLQQTAADSAEYTGLKKIGNHSAAMMESISDIVWAVNPQNDTVEKVVVKMKEFAAEILDPLNIKYEFIEKGNLGAVKLDPAKRKDLFLIFKEAVNNAAKYSHCCKINITLAFDGQNLHLHVTDNGKGFNQVAVKKGNGLRNMKARADNLSAHIDYRSNEGVGTSLQLAIPSHD